MSFLALVALATLLGLGGCRALPPPPPPIAVLSTSEVLNQLKTRQEQVRSFQAKGRIILLSSRWNYSGTGFLKGSLPTTLRVDVLDFLGRSLMSFYSNGQEVRVLSPKEAKFYCGPATPGNLAAFIPPGVTLAQVVHLLVGDLPLSPGPPARGHYEAAQGQYLFEWDSPGDACRERLWVEARSFNPVKEEWFDQDGQLRFIVEYSDFGQVAAHRPRQLILHTYQPPAELRLVYKEMQINSPLTAADLVVTRPPAVVEVPLKP
jgi:outer membrane lipoprotein-sorting protein